MAENWIPPTRENWELVVYCFQFFPLVKCSYSPGTSSPLTKTTGHDIPMGSAMVWSGQDVWQ